MTFLETKYSHNLQDIICLEFGTFYFCDKYIVSEINQSVNLDWEDVIQLVSRIIEHYGNANVNLISNRINDYSVNPLYWLDVMHSDMAKKILNYVIISNKVSGKLAAQIEKNILHGSINTYICCHLEEAINLIATLETKICMN